MKLRIVLVSAALLLAAALPARAEDHPVFEINPFGGYLFGGSFDRGSNAIFDTRVDVEDNATYGLRLGDIVNHYWEVELQYSRVETHFVSHGNGGVFGPGDIRLGNLDIDYFLAYSTFNFGKNSRIKPYVTLGAGAARLYARVPAFSASTDTRFTASIGGGVRTMFTPHFGLRFDTRYYTTLLNSNDNQDHHDGCHDCSNSNDHWLGNIDVNGGFVIAF
jgi:opacity protein-like surface antigen